jgi:hypothetical protein
MTPAEALFIVSFMIIAPEDVASRKVAGRLYCTQKSLWRPNRFLCDFGYDPDLLGRDEVDEKALLDLTGILRTTRKPFAGRTFLSLEAFAPSGGRANTHNSVQTTKPTNAQKIITAPNHRHITVFISLDNANHIPFVDLGTTSVAKVPHSLVFPAFRFADNQMNAKTSTGYLGPLFEVGSCGSIRRINFHITPDRPPTQLKHLSWLTHVSLFEPVINSNESRRRPMPRPKWPIKPPVAELSSLQYSVFHLLGKLASVSVGIPSRIGTEALDEDTSAATRRRSVVVRRKC